MLKLKHLFNQCINQSEVAVKVKINFYIENIICWPTLIKAKYFLQCLNYESVKLYYYTEVNKKFTIQIFIYFASKK